jgi:hypothetical protein
MPRVDAPVQKVETEEACRLLEEMAKKRHGFVKPPCVQLSVPVWSLSRGVL